MTHPILSAKVVSVRFTNVAGGRVGNRTYAYYTNIPDLKQGDAVIVMAPYSQGGLEFKIEGFSDPRYPVVVEVTSVEETVEAIEKVHEWIICKVDFAEYFDRRQKTRQVEILQAKIKKAAENARREIALESLADRSPALAELLMELQKLMGEA